MIFPVLVTQPYIVSDWIKKIISWFSLLIFSLIKIGCAWVYDNLWDKMWYFPQALSVCHLAPVHYLSQCWHSHVPIWYHQATVSWLWSICSLCSFWAAFDISHIISYPQWCLCFIPCLVHSVIDCSTISLPSAGVVCIRQSCSQFLYS